MRRQRREDRHKETPPLHRIAAFPFGNNNFYHLSEKYNSDDGSPSKLRRNSEDIYIGNAENLEDLIYTKNGSTNNHAYSKSFIMDSPIKTNESTKRLHQRHTNQNTNSNRLTPAQRHSRCDGNNCDDESPQHRTLRQRTFLDPRKNRSVQQLQERHQKFSTMHLARWSFGIGLSLYLILLVKSTYQLREHFMFIMEISNAPHIWNPKVDCLYDSRIAREIGCQQPVPSWYKEQWKQINDARSKRERRKNDRRDRTTLATYSNAITDDWYDILSLDQKNKLEGSGSMRGGVGRKDDLFASIDDLCGVTAKNSSIISPESYLSRTALNKNSRVLITGILNPVGLSLALHLKEHCGVRNLIGVDAMFPNTVLNRLLIQDRIELLNSNAQGTPRHVILSFFGLDPKAKSSLTNNNDDSVESELDWVKRFKPTHIAHLASYSIDVYNEALLHPGWKSIASPYISDDESFVTLNKDYQQKVNPYFYPLRSGMVYMEQLLQTIAKFQEKERPQFVYATDSFQSNITLDKYEILFRASKRMDELLADMHHSISNFGLPSIGLRLPSSIYGPWDHPGSKMHNILSRSIEYYSNALKKDASSILSDIPKKGGDNRLDVLFVDDAVNAIISALQYRSNKPITITVPAERTTSANFLFSGIQSLLNKTSSCQLFDINATKATSENRNELSLILPKTDQTSLKEGLVKSIAWHKDRLLPFGSAPISIKDANASIDKTTVETGDEFLQRHEMKTCEANDISCHKSSNYLPCNSECNTHQNCLPSIFDDVRELVYSVSEGCDVAMYTQMLGYNVEDAELHAEFMDDSDLEDDELLICNFAFVPRESDFVSLVTSKVPGEQLDKFGIEPRSSDKSSKDLRERKLDILNGRLLYRGWILIWVKDGMRELSAPDSSLLKLSPSKFFYPSVKYGLFVEDNFKVSPNLDDVLFLVDQMYRKKLASRSLETEVKIETPNGAVTKKIKISIPGEPARRAAVLLVPLRYPNINEPIIEQYREGNQKLTLYHASKFMGYEVGYQPGEKESSSIRRQREFYERIQSYVNKHENRSPSEPWYRFTLKHWVRSRWVLHDFMLEEARLLRCEWYQEHIQWGNDLDQLSFAKIMGMRDIKRRISHNEPDDHFKSFIEEHPELHGLTDSDEWHTMKMEASNLKEQDPIAEKTPLYVRIMSERVMDISRKIWTKLKKKKTNFNQEMER